MLPQFPPARLGMVTFSLNWREQKTSRNKVLGDSRKVQCHYTTHYWHNPTRTFFRFFLSSTGVLSSSKLSFTDSLFAPGDIHKFHDLGTVHGSKIYRPIEGFGWSRTTCSYVGESSRWWRMGLLMTVSYLVAELPDFSKHFNFGKFAKYSWAEMQ